jgi:hypothetical protein
MTKTIKIKIYADPRKTDATSELADIPWYPGITALQAMVIGGSLNHDRFSFRVLYSSMHGAFIDRIEDIEGDKSGHAWLFYINGKQSDVGASEAVLKEDTTSHTALLEWRYMSTSQGQQSGAAL